MRPGKIQRYMPEKNTAPRSNARCNRVSTLKLKSASRYAPVSTNVRVRMSCTRCLMIMIHEKWNIIKEKQIAISYAVAGISEIWSSVGPKITFPALSSHFSSMRLRSASVPRPSARKFGADFRSWSDCWRIEMSFPFLRSDVIFSWTSAFSLLNSNFVLRLNCRYSLIYA